jgi:hypothetical protein
VATGASTAEDRARFAAAAAASAPGTTSVNRERMARARERAAAASSWVGEAAAAWAERAGDAPDPALEATVEAARGAPSTPGWND